jgi:hypothetical protein
MISVPGSMAETIGNASRMETVGSRAGMSIPKNMEPHLLIKQEFIP